MLRRMLAIAVLIGIFLSTVVYCSFAEEVNEEFLPENYFDIDTIDIYDMRTDNIVNLPIRYIGTLTERIAGSPVTNRIGEEFVGEVPIYGFYDGCAYFPLRKQIYSALVNRFESIEPVGDEYNILSAYMTAYTGNSQELRENVNLAIKAVSGVVIEPEGKFNFNEICGPMTDERGYQEHPIVDGRTLRYEYGGGVSQITSTLYSAIMHNKNLEVTMLYPHGADVLYLPLGMDASIYNEKNFEFINHYPFSILVEISVTDISMIVIVRRA